MKIGQNVPEMFEADLSVEMLNQSCLKEAIALCEAEADFVTRDIFMKILDDTEEHIDWLETQQGLVEKTGLQNYLQEQIGKSEVRAEARNLFGRGSIYSPGLRTASPVALSSIFNMVSMQRPHWGCVPQALYTS